MAKETKDRKQLALDALRQAAQRMPLGEVESGKCWLAHADIVGLARADGCPTLAIRDRGGMCCVEIRNLLSADRLSTVNLAAKKLISREVQVAEAAAGDGEPDLDEEEASLIPLLLALHSRPADCWMVVQAILLAVNDFLPPITIAADADDGEVYLWSYTTWDEEGLDDTIKKLLFKAEFVTNIVHFIRRVIEPEASRIEQVCNGWIRKFVKMEAKKQPSREKNRSGTVSI